MKRLRKPAVLLACALPALGAVAIYLICCINAGQLLSWQTFSEGLIVHTTNCGGNSAAANRCREIAQLARMTAEDSGGTIDFSRTDNETAKSLSQLGSYHWTPDAKYLVRKGSIHFTDSTQEVIVVCDRAYGNVPQPSIWNLHRPTLLHAVGYSDGTHGWMTPKDFAALDKAKFIELKNSRPASAAPGPQ